MPIYCKVTFETNQNHNQCFAIVVTVEFILKFFFILLLPVDNDFVLFYSHSVWGFLGTLTK